MSSSRPLLYHAVPSRGLVVHWLLEELGVGYDMTVLDLAAGDQQTTAYRAINPLGKVPTLVHDGRVVTETAAICMYLAETFSERGMDVPAGSPQRGDYLRWMFGSSGQSVGD